MKWDPFYVRPDGRILMAEIWAKEEAERNAQEAKMIANAKADAKAVWALADCLMPTDFLETAERLKMQETMREIWRSAFIAGWRAAQKE